MRIWLIRHGMTRLSEEKRYQGSTDTRLSERGRSALLRADLAHPGCCADHVYVSPALRARETASILFPQARQIVFDGLREMNFGLFEGRTWREMADDRLYREWVDGGCIGRCPGGEDRASFSDRICSAFEQLLDLELYDARNKQADRFEDNPKERTGQIMIVAHGGTQMALLKKYGVPARDFYQWQTPRGYGWLLEMDPAGGRLKVLDRVSFVKE